jgi:glucokinase
MWVGVDIGGTKTAIVLSPEPPAVIARVEFPTRPAEGPDPAIRAINQTIRDLLAAQAVTELYGIGVSCGGPLNRITGVIQAPPNLSTWIDVPIKSILETEFHTTCRLENDANGGAVAEHRFGAGRGLKHMVFLTMGTGLGAGVIADGRLYHGATDLAGEIGHVRLTPTGPVGYGKAGSAEGWASGAGMAQVATRMVEAARRRGKKTMLAKCAGPGQTLTARDVGMAAQQGDALAKRIIRATGGRLGKVLALLVDILNPERIVIGGLGMRLGDQLLEPARQMVRREALAPAAAACEIVPATLGESIGDIAALCVATGF